MNQNQTEQKTIFMNKITNEHFSKRAHKTFIRTLKRKWILTHSRIYYTYIPIRTDAHCNLNRWLIQHKCKIVHIIRTEKHKSIRNLLNFVFESSLYRSNVFFLCHNCYLNNSPSLRKRTCGQTKFNLHTLEHIYIHTN